MGNNVVTVFNANSDYAEQFIENNTKVLYTKNNKDINRLLSARRHMPSAKTDDIFIQHSISQNSENDNILFSYAGRNNILRNTIGRKRSIVQRTTEN